MFMNKKVLTLCVSALLAGGMIGTVNALPVNPTQIETKATSEENVLEMKSLPGLGRRPISRSHSECNYS